MPTCAFQHLAEHVDTPQLASSFEATISKFDKNFSAHLLDLLARLSIYSTSDCEHGMASVISRWVWQRSRHACPCPLVPVKPRLPCWLPVLLPCQLHPHEAGSAQAQGHLSGASFCQPLITLK